MLTHAHNDRLIEDQEMRKDERFRAQLVLRVAGKHKQTTSHITPHHRPQRTPQHTTPYTSTHQNTPLNTPHHTTHLNTHLNTPPYTTQHTSTHTSTRHITPQYNPTIDPEKATKFALEHLEKWYDDDLSAMVLLRCLCGLPDHHRLKPKLRFKVRCLFAD